MKHLLFYFGILLHYTATAQVNSTLIHNIWLIDGTGKPAIKCDLRIEGKIIKDTGNLKALPGETVINGNGMCLAPGFIDSHSHHYGDLKAHPDAIPAINQCILA
jgi:N-acyl-D-amino-acid deacylase